MYVITYTNWFQAKVLSSLFVYKYAVYIYIASYLTAQLLCSTILTPLHICTLKIATFIAYETWSIAT